MLHNIDQLIEKWTKTQITLSKSIIKKNNFNKIKLLGGLDISFVKNSNRACVTLAILSYPDLKLVHQISEMVTIKCPYVSGFLAFREVEHFVNILNK